MSTSIFVYIIFASKFIFNLDGVSNYETLIQGVSKCLELTWEFQKGIPFSISFGGHEIDSDQSYSDSVKNMSEINPFVVELSAGNLLSARIMYVSFA